MFNLRVPLPDRGEVFLMNTLTDAQLIVGDDVAGLLDRLTSDPASLAPECLTSDQREALVALTEHGFIVPWPPRSGRILLCVSRSPSSVTLTYPRP